LNTTSQTKELIMHRGILFALTAIAVCLCASTGVRAAPVGTQGFADIGTPTAGGSPTGDIDTATSFTLGSLVTTSADTGFLTGMPTQSFGSVSFSLSSPTSLSFSSTAFGTFTSTSITEASNVAGAVAIYTLGNWTPGTFGGQTGGPFATSFTISFTQSPAHIGSISDSATFSVPPANVPGVAVAAVPEPASIVMGLTSLVICGGLCYRHRRRRSSPQIATA
jgi:hypothetical protein